MNVETTHSEVYLGVNAGEEIYNAIVNASDSITIVSPYLSSSYIDLLTTASENNVKVTLITNSDFVNNNTTKIGMLKKIIVQDRTTDKEAKSTRTGGMLFIYLLLLGLLLVNLYALFEGHYTWCWSIVSLCVLLPILEHFTKMRIYHYTYRFLIAALIYKSKHQDHEDNNMNFFIHSKVFIIDDKICFLGSTNFTYSAFRKNYECVVKITDYAAIDEILKEINNIQDRETANTLSLEEIVQSIYEEPAN